MGRPDLNDTIELLLETKKINPNIAIGTDLIAGYPGETERNFRSLVRKI